MQSAQVIGLSDLARQILEHAHVSKESREHRIALPRGFGVRLGKFQFWRAVEERDANRNACIRSCGAAILRAAFGPTQRGRA